MDKLRELLNEFEPYIWGDGEYYDNIWLYRTFLSDKTVRNNAVRYIVSKEYEFVAWIVENKKFKPYKAYTDFLYWASSRIEFENWPTIVSVNKQLYDSILCALALSDKPLELLSSIIL